MPTRSNVLRDHRLCYQESCLRESLCVLRIRFGRPSIVRRARPGVLETPELLLSGVAGKPEIMRKSGPDRMPAEDQIGARCIRDTFRPWRMRRRLLRANDASSAG